MSVHRKHIAGLVLPLVAFALASCDTAPDPAGDWAGWAYLETAGDLPLRLHLELASDGAYAARLDSPAQQEVDLPIQ